MTTNISSNYINKFHYTKLDLEDLCFPSWTTVELHPHNGKRDGIQKTKARFFPFILNTFCYINDRFVTVLIFNLDGTAQHKHCFNCFFKLCVMYPPLRTVSFHNCFIYPDTDSHPGTDPPSDPPQNTLNSAHSFLWRSVFSPSCDSLHPYKAGCL